MKKQKSTVRIFSDEKLWTVDQPRNTRNDRFIAFSHSEVHHIHTTKHPASAIMFEVVSSDSKRMTPYWFLQGLKIDQNEYLEVLKTVVKPWIYANYKNVDFVWQQDSAPGHKTKKTQAWCKENFKNFWSTFIWPPNSSGLTPLEYGIWGFAEGRASAKPHSNVASLNASVKKEWTLMSEEFARIPADYIEV